MSPAGIPDPIARRIILIHRLSAVLFPALLVFSPALPNILLAILAVSGLLVADYSRFTRFRGRTFVAVVLVFIIWKLIGVGYSEDTAEAWSLLTRQITLLAIPFFYLFPEKIRPKDAKWAFYLFSLACLIMAVYSLGASLYTYRENLQYVGGTNIYSFVPLHASYYSMYLVMVFFFLLREGMIRIRKNQMRRAALLMLVTGFLFVYILMINARTTSLLFMSLLALTAIVYFFKSTPRFRYLTVGLTLVLAIGTYLLIQNSYMVQNDLVNRFESALSTRIDIWSAGWDAAMVHPVAGSGTGDSRRDIFATYESRGMTDALAHRYNTHSQYLETWIRHGLIGVVILVAIWLTLGAAAYRRKRWTFGLFVLLVAGECLTEVMLDRQMGLYFIGSFAALFYLMDKPVPLHEDHA